MLKPRAVPIIVGNWKATPATLKEAVKFVRALDRKIISGSRKLPQKAYYLAVPESFIFPLADIARRGYIGAQNISGISLGQFTGAAVPSQLSSAGASFAIVGHSEVRALGETDDSRAHKVALSLQSKLATILCVGEHKRDKEGSYLAELEEDIKRSLALVDRGLFGNLIIAYEPLWAIGAKVPATPQECFEAVIALRRALASLVGIDHAKKVRILYGGAVNENNERSFLEEGGVDGLLIGRGSQEVASFYRSILSCHP